jgi:hypothetical protein
VGVRVRTGLLLEFGWYLVCDLFDYDDDEDDDDDHYDKQNSKIKAVKPTLSFPGLYRRPTHS